MVLSRPLFVMLGLPYSGSSRAPKQTGSVFIFCQWSDIVIKRQINQETKHYINPADASQIMNTKSKSFNDSGATVAPKIIYYKMVDFSRRKSREP